MNRTTKHKAIQNHKTLAGRGKSATTAHPKGVKPSHGAAVDSGAIRLKSRTVPAGSIHHSTTISGWCTPADHGVASQPTSR